MATNEENKRLELLTKYTNWIKKKQTKTFNRFYYLLHCFTAKLFIV